jgi:hypothetical protein
MPESLMDALNEFIRQDPTLSQVFGATSSPAYHYWTLKKGEKGNRYEQEFCYATQRAQGPGGQQAGWWSWVYVVRPTKRGREFRLQRAARSATRRKAKARAYRLFAQAMGWPPEQQVWRERKRIDWNAPAPPAEPPP